MWDGQLRYAESFSSILRKAKSRTNIVSILRIGPIAVYYTKIYKSLRKKYFLYKKSNLKTNLAYWVKGERKIMRYFIYGNDRPSLTNN